MTMTSPQQTNPNPSPKARFQSSPDNVVKHRRLLELPELQRAFDFALLQYSAKATQEMKDQLSAIAAAAKVQAAHEFIAEFRMLGETAPPLSARVDTDNLGGN